MRKPLIVLLAAAPLILAATYSNAADLPARYTPPPPYVSQPPAFTWTGFYVGVNAGYGWNAQNDRMLRMPGGRSDANGGFVGGGQIGYNYQLMPGTGLVIGLEGDLQYADLGADNGSVSRRGPQGGYFGTVRGRLGHAFDRVLVYGTGGFAYGDVGNNVTGPAFRGSNSTDASAGWTLGGGLEYAFTTNLSAKVEGLYVSLERDSRTGYGARRLSPVAANNNRDEFGIVRAGLNYKFSTY